MSRRAAIYLRAPAGADPRRAIDDWLRSEHFLPWDALPRGYPASPEEVRELVYRGPADRGPADRGPADRGPADRGPADRGPDGSDGWAEVTPAAFEFVFRFALEMARRSPDIAALAVTDRWDGRVCAKLYRGDRVLLKVGEDRDDELPYFIPPAEPETFVEAGRALALPRAAADGLAAWGRRVAGGEPPELGALARAFALPAAPGRFADRRAAIGPEPSLEYLLSVHRTSPLYRNA